ncbi:MAG: hypothetical protein Q8R02_06300 [Hyphomonadaceae bacterium]|nr:hypothetical protein [Hyphomonadaceae bacterium]
MKRIFGSAAIGAFLLAAACAGTSSTADDQVQGAAPEGVARMSFFVTSVSPGKGGDYGGLAGADAHCATLAQAAGSPRAKTWRAYLSAAPMNGQPQVNARDRIGKGPWHNAKGVEIAANIDELHNPDNAKMAKETNLTEKGEVNPGRGDPVNIHDGVTGSDMQGRLAPPEVAAGREGAPQLPLPPNMTCNNWTSSDPQLSTMVGHIDRQGFVPNAKSWTTAHPSRGCSQPGLVSTGGAGQFYCFATN